MLQEQNREARDRFSEFLEENGESVERMRIMKPDIIREERDE